MNRTTIAALSALACATLLLTACEREKRPTQAPPAASGTTSRSHAASADVMPAKNRYEENAYAVSQGQTWFKAYNCAGCHSGGGGGGMGPPLMDNKWRYGSEPENVFQSISQGRPNGMPSFRDHVPEDQIWQLVAYVRSLSGQLREDVPTSRPDDMMGGKAIDRRKKEEPKHEQTPAAE